ncbi:hypothetical protein MCEMIH16_02842 [Caulobacteraceae bacterium]
MDWPLITAIIAGLAIFGSGWLVWATRLAMGPYREVEIRNSLGNRLPASWPFSLALFGMLALVGSAAIAGQVGILLVGTPPNPLFILWFAAILVAQIAFLLKVRRQRSRRRQAQEDLFGR